MVLGALFVRIMIYHIPRRLTMPILSLSIAFLNIRSSAFSIAPALTFVPETSAANVQLFKSERIQLKDDIVDSIARHQYTAYLADLIAFDSNNTQKKWNFTSCKTYPDDALWPLDSVWDDFDALLDGGLIPTVPIASPCYNTRR